MSTLHFSPIESQFTTPVPNAFITQKMPEASASYVKVYLYTYYVYFNRIPNVTFEDIGSALDILESDVLKALRYWNKKEALSLIYDKAADQYTVRFDVPFTPDPNEPAKASSKKNVESTPSHEATMSVPSSQTTLSDKSEVTSSQETPSKIIRIEQKPNYDPEEISLYQADPTVAALFSGAQQILGGPFSSASMKILFSFFDYYRMPTDVILILLAYCVEGGHRDMRYIEKVVIDWTDKGIDTPQKAEEHLHRIKVFRPLLIAFNITNPMPTPEMSDAFERWFSKYNMPLELIEEACKRSYQKKHSCDLSYTEGILKKWHKKGITTLMGVMQQDAVHEAEKQRSTTRKKTLSNYTTSSAADQDLEALFREAGPRTFKHYKEN